MAVVYIADQGALVCKKNDRLYVYKAQQLLRWFHTKDLAQLILVGNVALSTPTITYLLKHRIDTVFISYYGKYKGRLIGEFGKNVALRLAQFDYLAKETNREMLANIIVAAKIQNSIALLKKRKPKDDAKSIQATIIKNQAICDLLKKNTLPLSSIRGYEGIAAKNYFAVFPALIKNKDFPFNGRNKRPPKDEVNALLSLSYTFLMNQVMCAAYICGLDVYYGSLHEIDYGRQSLVLDLMEEFRPLADNMVFTLINRKEIRLEHFVYNVLNDEENPEYDPQNKLLPVSLANDGMRIIITAFNKLINTKIANQDPPGNWSLKDIFALQTRKLANHFENKKEYSPFVWL
ncbi:MAG: CRISPR-associated endonuclease Cas1 [Candidatus Cloacimonetes bacterium]|nr:CRISPR-associated endonuclease Cas1 [Candidatus Cloacimonadota bacterium]